MQSRRGVLGAATLLLVVGGIVALVVVRGGSPSAPALVSPTPSTPPPSTPPPTVAPVRRESSCPTHVAHPFEPASITIRGVARGIGVVTPPRDSHDVPGVPPLTDTGKRVFAYDREQLVRPGDVRGNVLLNAHTWPDGSALGNDLLAGLRHHGRIVVEGKGHQELCYRVTRRTEVLATAHVPSYFSRTGPPQLAIIVCSGRRLGPEQWEKRTIWYASPSA